MRAEQKIKFLTWGIVVLTLLNVSTIGTIIYHIQTEKKQMGFNSERYPGPLKGRELMEHLDFTAQQRESFHSHNRDFMEAVSDINRSLNESRNNLFAELQKTNPDTVKCNLISAEIGRLHKALKIKTYRFYLDVKKICNEEQREKLNKAFAPVFSFDGGQQFRHRGRGHHWNSD